MLISHFAPARCAQNALSPPTFQSDGLGRPRTGARVPRLSVRIPHTLNERLSVPVLCWQLASKGPVTVIMTVAVVVVKQKEGVSRQ